MIEGMNTSPVYTVKHTVCSHNNTYMCTKIPCFGPDSSALYRGII